MSTKRVAADIIGYLIAVLLGCMLLPQIIKTIKCRHTLGLSIKMVLLNVLIEEYPLLAGEIVVTVFSLLLLYYYIKYRVNTRELKNDTEIPIPKPRPHVHVRV